MKVAHTWDIVEIETTREMEHLLNWLSLLAIPDQVELLLRRRIRDSFFFDSSLSPAICGGSTGVPPVPGVERLLDYLDVPSAVAARGPSSLTLL